MMLFASGMRWGWRNCFVVACLPGSCFYLGLFFFFFFSLRKAVRAYIREKNPLNFLSGSHSGYMIKKECISLSRPWLAWPGEMLGPPMRIRQTVEFGLFPVHPHYFGQMFPSQCSCLYVILHKSLNFFFLKFFTLLLGEIQKRFIYSCLPGLESGWSAVCAVMPWWKLPCKLW